MSAGKKPQPVLYIIHGWTYTTEPWQKTRELLKQAGLDTVMLRVPGLTSPSDKVWTVAEYAAWADKHLPDGAVALGHSNGGRILLNLCAEKPQKLQKLILLNSAGVYEVSRKREWSRRLAKMFAPLKRLPGARKVVHKLLGAQDYDRAPANMKQTLANMIDSDKQLEIEKVSTPTVLLWGEKDTTTPLRQGRKLAQRLPRVAMRSFAEWQHAPYLTHPEELAKAILQAYRLDASKIKVKAKLSTEEKK